MPPLEQPAAQFPASRHVLKPDGEIGLSVYAVADLPTMAGGHFGGDAPLREIAFQHVVEQRSLLDLLKCGFGSPHLRGSGSGKRDEIPSRHLRDVFRLCEKIRAACKLSGKGEDVAAASQPEVEPHVPVRIDLERRRPFFAVGSVVPQIVSFPPYRTVPQPCKEIFYRKPSDPVHIHRLKTKWFPLFFLPLPPRRERLRHFPTWRSGSLSELF